jgi:hypothetical protein
VSVRKHFESFESFVIQSGDLIREGHHRCGRRRIRDIMRGRAEADLTFIAQQNEDMRRELSALSELSGIHAEIRALRRETIRGAEIHYINT